ncbi:hypothetical protein VIBNIFTn2_120243 [Vibrio nigripulchritudo FTn2]|nr:hypothetical protein VIBNIFTn2_120243 [Vibrio nigripulchritudo FTn2]
MKLSRGEQVPKHRVELRVYIFSRHPSSQQPLAMLQHWVEGIHEYSWQMLSAYGQTGTKEGHRSLPIQIQN